MLRVKHTRALNDEPDKAALKRFQVASAYKMSTELAQASLTAKGGSDDDEVFCVRLSHREEVHQETVRYSSDEDLV